MNVKKNLVKSFVWSVMIYGCEARTLGKKGRKKLKLVQMWIWRRLTRACQMDRKSNEMAFDRGNEGRSLLKVIRKRT